MKMQIGMGGLKKAGKALLAPGVLALALAGCGGGGGDGVVATPNPDPIVTPAPTPTVARGVVQGRVLDAENGAPVVGAIVKAGTVSATSGAGGAYVLNNVVAAARVVLVANASDYAETVKVSSASENATTTFDLKLLKVAATANINQVTGGTVTVPGSVAQVVLPTNFAAKADGSAPVGPVTVKVTPIATATDSSLMPGDYTTVVGTGAVSIESFGALTVNLTDSTGAALNLAAAKSATIRIPVSTRSAVTPPTIPLFFVSAETGRWVQEGSATLAGTAPNRYYEGVVTHFSTWNADQVLDSVVVSGCVKNEGGVLTPGVTVSSDGINYSGVSSATTDAGGNFQIRIKKSGTVILGGFSDNKSTNEISAGPRDADFTIVECLQLATIANSIRVKLTWGASPDDVDSYMTLPTGEVISYKNEGNLLAAPFINLDVDDTASFGPEVVTVRKLMVGTYKYAVRNYSGTHAPGITGSPAKVELTVAGNTSLFAPPPGEASTGNTIWNAFNLVVTANCSVTITPVNTWSLVEPVSAATVPAAVFCVE